MMAEKASNFWSGLFLCRRVILISFFAAVIAIPFIMAPATMGFGFVLLICAAVTAGIAIVGIFWILFLGISDV